jgi:hypothetical protein
VVIPLSSQSFSQDTHRFVPTLTLDKFEEVDAACGVAYEEPVWSTRNQRTNTSFGVKTGEFLGCC